MDDLDKRLKPYFHIALQETSKSECLRRKYAAMIIYDWYGDVGDPGTEWNPWHLAANTRVSKQCSRKHCIRNTTYTPHGQYIERGAEIHAEAAVLIKAGINNLKAMHSYFILVGKDSKTGRELKGNDCLPCHVCALMIKWAGYGYIYHKDIAGRIMAISIEEIIEYREKEIEATVYETL